MAGFFDDLSAGVGSVFQGLGAQNPFQPADDSEPAGYERQGAGTPQATMGAPKLREYQPAGFQARAPMQEAAPAQPPGQTKPAYVELPPPPEPPSAEPPPGYSVYGNPIETLAARVLDPVGDDADRRASWARNTQPVYAAQVNQYEAARKIQGQQLASAAASGDWDALGRLYTQHPDVYEALNKDGGISRAIAPHAQALDVLSNKLANAKTAQDQDDAVRSTAALYPQIAGELAKHSGPEWRSRLGLLRDLAIKGMAAEQKQEETRRELSGYGMAPKEVREANAEAFMTPGGHAIAAPMVYDKRTGTVAVNLRDKLTRNPDGTADLKPGATLIAPKDVDDLAKEYRQTGKKTLEVYQDVKRLQDIMSTPAGDKGPWKKQHVVDVLARIGTGGKASKWNVMLGEEGQSLAMQLKNFISKQRDNDPLSPEAKDQIRSFLTVAQPGIARALADEVAPFARRAGSGNVPIEAIFGKDAAALPEVQSEYAAGRDAILARINANPETARTGLLTQETYIPRGERAQLPASQGVSASFPPVASAPAGVAAPAGNSPLGDTAFAAVPPTSGGGGSGPSASYEGKVAQIESGGDYSARAKNSSAYGAFQFTRGTGAKYGVLPGATPEQQREGFRRLTADNAKSLGNAGLPVNDVTLYMAHQQGAGGASKLLKADGGAIAADVVGRREAGNNPAFFYEGGDTRKRPLTVDEVKAKFAQKIGGTAPASQFGTGSIGSGNTTTPLFTQPGVSEAGAAASPPDTYYDAGLRDAKAAAPGLEDLLDTAIGAVAKSAAKVPAGAPAALQPAAMTAHALGTAAGEQGLAAVAPASLFSTPLRAMASSAAIGAAPAAWRAAVEQYEKGEVSADTLVDAIIGGAVGGAAGLGLGVVSKALGAAGQSKFLRDLKEAPAESIVSKLDANPGSVAELEKARNAGDPIAHEILQKQAAQRVTAAEGEAAQNVTAAESEAAQRLSATQQSAQASQAAAEQAAASGLSQATTAEVGAKTAAEQAAAGAQTAAESAAAKLAPVEGDAAEALKNAAVGRAQELEAASDAAYARTRELGGMFESSGVVSAAKGARQALADADHLESTLGPASQRALYRLDKVVEELGANADAPIPLQHLIDIDQRITSMWKGAKGNDRETLGIIQGAYREKMVDTFLNKVISGDGAAVAKSYDEARAAFRAFKSYLEPRGKTGKEAELVGFKILAKVAGNPEMSLPDVVNTVLGLSNSGFGAAATHTIDAFRKTFGDDPKVMGAFKSLALERAIGPNPTPKAAAKAITDFLSSAKSKAVAQKLFSAEELRAAADTARELARLGDDAASKAKLAALAEKAVARAENEGESLVARAEREASSSVARAEREGERSVDAARRQGERSVDRARAQADRYAGPAPEPRSDLSPWHINSVIFSMFTSPARALAHALAFDGIKGAVRAYQMADRRGRILKAVGEAGIPEHRLSSWGAAAGLHAAPRVREALE